MKSESNKKTEIQPYKLNNFVDFQSNIDGKFNEWEIIDMQQSKILVKSVRDDYKNFVDITSQKLKPFRIVSRPIEFPITYHKSYSYWGDGFYWSLQYLKKIKEQLSKLKPIARVNREGQIDEQCGQVFPAKNNKQQQISLDPVQIIQQLRGKIYYCILSINDDKKITEAARQKILQFVLEFLDFFTEYFSIFNWSETEIKNIYESPRNALMSSYPQILINLLLIFNRRSYLEPPTDTGQRQKLDKIMNYAIGWLQNSLIPRICQGSFQKINFQIAIKLAQLFIKLTGTDRLPRTEKTEECIRILLTYACNQTKKITLNKFTLSYQSMEDILINCTKTQKQFLYSKICKICLLRRFQNILIAQNHHYSPQKSATFAKHMSFIIACMEEPELKNQVLKYLSHEYGLAYYLKNTPSYSPTLNETLSKLSRFCPQMLIYESIRLKKIQYTRHSSIQWSFKLLISIMKSFAEQKKVNERQELIQNKDIHKIVTNELKNLLQKQDQNSLSEEKNQLYGMIRNIQIRIIHLYQALFDGQRTVTVEYIEKSVVPKYVDYQFEKIILTLEEKETNLFRQLFILKQLHKKINLTKQNQVSKNLYIAMFSKLCKSMPLYKAKTILQPRRQLLFLMLSKIINIFPEQFTTLFCHYIESVKKVMNKQFKTKALEQYPTLINTKANLFKNQEQKIRKFKKIIDSMKIETLSQFKIFMFFFKAVANYENTIKIDQLFNPLVIYKRPYGIQKIYEVYRIKNCEKVLFKKIESFFLKINLKFVDMGQKSKFVQELTENLVDILRNIIKTTLEWNKNDLIKQIQLILQSLIKSHHDYKMKEMINFDFDYSKLFIDKSTKLNQQMENNYQVSDVIILSQSNIQKQVDGGKEKENKNSKIKVTVLFERDEVPRNQQEYSSEAGDQISNEMEEEIKNKNGKFQLYVERDQRLYSIKSKAAISFQISPIASNFILGNQQIPHCDQAMTVQFLLQMASLNEEGQKGQNQQLTISLKQQPRQETAKKILLKNLDILYLCLPQTDKLWMGLGVGMNVWTQQHKLRQLKQNFIRYQPQDDSSDEMAYEDGRDQLNYWGFIMDSPMKRNMMMEALIADNQLNLSKVKWLFYSFSQIKNKNDLNSNFLSFRLIHKSQKFLTEQETEKVLQKIKINQRQLSQSSLQEFKQYIKIYESFLRNMFTYIEQHINFNLFPFIMRMDHQFFDNLSECERYSFQFWYLLSKSFVRYTTGTDKYLNSFLHSQLESYVLQFPKSFNFFILNLEKSNIHYNNEGYSRVLDLLLQRSIDMIVNDSRFNSEFNSHFFSTYLLLSLISILLYKERKSNNIINQNFINILNGFLYSKLCNQTISIISSIVGRYPSHGQKFIQQFRREMDEPDWERKQIIKFNKSSLRHESDYVGLKNPHSICYVNSLLQQLFHNKMFREQIYLTNWKKNSSIDEDLIFQLKRIFINLHLLHCDSYYNKYFFEAFKNDEGSATSLEVQMDVDQFRSILFDRIENLIIKPENQTRNFVQNIFNGKQLTIIKSKQCEHESTRQEQFSSICLQVKGLKKLQDSLTHYFHPETLDGDNMYFCDVCGKKVVAQKTNQIKQYPRYLTFVLKRFEYVYQYRKKINERFEFPLEVLQLGGNRYYLKGVIVHQGLSQAGHYFSLIKLKGKWFEFNDNTISQVTQKDVANLGYGDSNTKCNRNAYLLFYERQGDSDITTKQMSSNRNILPLQLGLDDEIADIIKCNRLLWKADLFLSEQYQNFIQTVVREKIKGSVLLLYQYITTIKVKRLRFELKNLKTLFQLLQKNMTENFLDSQEHVSWALQFYRNSQFNSSLKAALTKILVKNYERFDEYLKKFLKMCIIFIHEQTQTSHYYHLFLEFSKKSPEILKYLVDARIIGRIFDISYTQLLLTIDRHSLSQTTQISFPLMEYFKNSRKKAAEHNELRYHKWKLINFILRSGVELHKIQNNYIYQWNQRKSQLIFEQGQSKVTINQISKYFCYLTQKNQTFGDLYLKQVCEQISKDKTQNLRRYLKAASDLMKINDSQKMYRMTKIKQAFAETLKMLHKQKIMSSFDLKWQWFIRIGFINPEFRRIIRSSVEQFKIINTKSELQNLYLARNESNSEGKYKNKYFGLRFSSVGSTSNNNFLEEKFERNRILFFGNQNDQIFADLSIQCTHFDTDLTDFPEQEITEDMTILRFSEQTSKFKQVMVTECLGECIEIQNQRYDIGDERLMHCFEKTIAIKKQQEAKKLVKQQEMCSN